MSTVNQCGAGRSLFRFIYGVNALLLKASDGKFIVYYFMKNENIIALSVMQINLFLNHVQCPVNAGTKSPGRCQKNFHFQYSF